MDLQKKMEREAKKWTEGLLIFAVLLGFGFFINRGVELKGLYMDDLYLWSCYGEQSFREYVFPIGGTRFRFVFYLASWIELFFLGNHVEWMVPFNIILNAGIAYSLYRMAVSFSGGRKLVSLSLGLAFLSSRMAYYQIGQFYGLMESLGLWVAIGILYFLFCYMDGRKPWAYVAANVLYFLASFIHERYMVLLPVLFLGLLLGDGRRQTSSETGKKRESLEPGHTVSSGRSRGRAKSREKKPSSVKQDKSRFSSLRLTLLLLVMTFAVFGLIQGIRFATIGTLSPAGTGGTDVADTFQMVDAMDHAWEQVAFVFGRNSGPDYLCILPYEETPANIQRLILISNLTIGVLVLLFLAGWIRDEGHRLTHLRNTLLFLGFIAFCIASSSVTIRVEMRWIYVVYAAALLFLAYMSSVMGKAGLLVFLYVGLTFSVESFYREHWDNLYLWPNQLRYNSLAEQTVEKYGDEIFEKDIYIIGNTYEMSDFTAETFLKVYDREGKAKKLQFIDSDFDFRRIKDDMLILSEDPEHNAYQDVTEFIKKQRWNLAYGWYEDGWVDEHAKLVFLNKNSDKVILSCYYPGTITGEQVCSIRVNGKRLPDLVFTDNSMTYEIEAAPYQMISLELSCNFYVANAKETRGEEKLAMIVGID